MIKVGQRVVVRNSHGDDIELGTVQDIVETEDTYEPLQVRVRFENGGVRVVSPDILVEHLED